MNLRTIYQIEAIPIIRNFIFSICEFYGANEKEKNELTLAVEEAAEHIIENFPSDEKELFEVKVKIKKDKQLIQVILKNKGIPIDEKNIPQYTPENPEDSIDGLKFFLIKKLTDNFEFINCGNDGWQTILDKKISNFNIPRTKKSYIESSNKEKSKFNISVAIPDDSYKITKLAYHTYRYTYTKTSFYYPEILKEHLEERNIISFVAKNEEDEVIAHSALIRSPECREIAEAGALMTHPTYRHSTALIRIAKKLYNYALQKDNNIVILESNLVTTHTGSQRLTKHFKFCPLALKLSVHEKAKFINIKEQTTNQRESLLYSISLTQKPKIESILYVPKEHQIIIKNLIQHSGLPALVKKEYNKHLKRKTEFLIKKDNRAMLTTIIIKKFGIHWQKELKNIIKDLCIKNFKTIHLKIFTDNPLPWNIDESLLSLKFFFSGICLRTISNFTLLYTYLNNQNIDFNEINLFENKAIELKDYVQQYYNLVDLI